jgi:purine-nucleoside phosphorylase
VGTPGRTGPDSDPLARPRAAAAADAAALGGLAERAGLTGDRHDVAVVLGSGWQPVADAFGPADLDVAMAELPGFVPPGVGGHPGRVRSIDVAGTRTLVLLGRTHLYEGHGVDAVAHGVRVAAAAGCRTVVLTNGCGSLRPEWGPGTPVLIRDHLNLTGRSPLRGPAFVDLTDAYAERLRSACRALDPTLPEGVYGQFAGPQYETPAEIRMLRALGGDLVGMSTALETVAAREAGLAVLGLSLVTNLAAGMTGEPLSHAEVLAAGRAAAQRMASLLRDLIPQVAG